MTAVEEQLFQVQRDINCLLDQDRNIRRQGLNKLNDFFRHPDQSKIIIFEKYVIKNLIRAFDDKIEKNREIALNILQLYLNIPRNSEIPLDLAEIIIKSLISRLNQIPYLETSEELRLTIIKILTQLIQTNSVQPFMFVLPDYSNMLHKALCDQFPEMKKVTSELCSISALNLKKNIGGYLLNVVKQLSINMTHQHSRVRKVSVEALKNVILCEASGPYLEYALNTIKALTQDKATDVRKATFFTIAQLLQGMSTSNLAMFENQLYLLLLNGLSDDNNEIQQQTLQQLEDVGKEKQLFEQELNFK